MGDIERAVREVPEGLELRVWVQPGASRTEMVGVVGDALKIRIAAPPQGGKANQALIEFLAELFGVPKSSVRLVQGQATRRKLVRIQGVTLADVRRLGRASA